MVCIDDNDEILAEGQESANFKYTHDLLHVAIKAHITAPPSESFTFRKYKDITLHKLIPWLETCDWTALLACGRNRDPHLLSEFLELRKEIEERTEDARSTFLKNQISDALDEGKNMGKEPRHLGLIPKPK